MKLTEKSAAIAYAKMWNRAVIWSKADCSEFLHLLAEDCGFASQWSPSDMKGKTMIAKHLTAKITSVTCQGAEGYAELGTIKAGTRSGRDCVLMITEPDLESNDYDVQIVVLFTVADGEIIRYDLCDPEMFRTKRTRIIPEGYV